MSVRYTNFNSPDLNKACVVCLEDPSESSKNWVVHTGGYNHPIHQECLNIWLRTKPFCPTCRSPVELSLTKKISNYFRLHAPTHTGVLAGFITGMSIITLEGYWDSLIAGISTGVPVGFICGTIIGFLKESAFLGIGIFKHDIQDLSQLKQKLITIPYESLRFGSKSIGVAVVFMSFTAEALRYASTYHGLKFLESNLIYTLPWFPIAIVGLPLQVFATGIASFLVYQATSNTTRFIANKIF